MQVFQEEVHIAEQLLSNLVALLPELNTLDDSDRRMQGKLELTLQLSRALGSRGLASTDSKHLVRLLLTGKHCWLQQLVFVMTALVSMKIVLR